MRISLLLPGKVAKSIMLMYLINLQCKLSQIFLYNIVIRVKQLFCEHCCALYFNVLLHIAYYIVYDMKICYLGS
jgi:hypothetical protein